MPVAPTDPHALLAGAYRLHPGGVPSITGGRPAVEPRHLEALLRGHAAADVPARLAAVFTLCSHAHRRASELAIAGASGRPALQRAGSALLFETVRDHLRSVTLDWPSRLGSAPPQLGWLRDCPFALAGPAPADPDAALRDFGTWWFTQVVRMAVEDWKAVAADDPGLSGWCAAQSSRLAPAQWLSRAHAVGGAILLPARPLAAIGAPGADRDSAFTALGQHLAGDPGFACRPACGNQPAENGPWLRMSTQLPFTGSLWTRLAARWRELGSIAAGSATLCSGTVCLGPRQALGWCEMARGLLVHWVHLDPEGRVDAYRVLAPTEWNFHPEGVLAREVGRLEPNDQHTAQVLAAAFDPCVVCTIGD